MTQDGIQVELRDTAEHVEARCRIDESRLSSVLASLASDSILFLGVPHADDADGAFAPTVRAVPLPFRVDPHRSSAEYEGSDLVLTLAKPPAKADADPSR